MLTFNLQSQQTDRHSIRPLSLWRSIGLFAGPAALFIFVIYWMWPRLEATTFTPYEAFLVVTTLPLALLLAAAALGFILEGHPRTWAAFRQRMRLPKLGWRDIGSSLLIVLIAFLGIGILTPITNWLIEHGFLPIPAGIPPLIDPRNALSPDALANFTEGPLRGRWEIPLYFAIYLFFNIAGEELFWRGYILPRQEAQHGRYAWLIHGLLWNLFHAFKWWDLLNILPVTLAISYFSQRSQSTWPAIIAHAILNGLTLIALLGYVLG